MTHTTASSVVVAMMDDQQSLDILVVIVVVVQRSRLADLVIRWWHDENVIAIFEHLEVMSCSCESFQPSSSFSCASSAGCSLHHCMAKLVEA
jgi:hypothetical protein